MRRQELGLGTTGLQHLQTPEKTLKHLKTVLDLIRYNPENQRSRSGLSPCLVTRYESWGTWPWPATSVTGRFRYSCRAGLLGFRGLGLRALLVLELPARNDP